MANKLKVRILSREYNLVSEDSLEYMQRIADLTDQKMREAIERNSSLSTSDASVLIALNFADELEKVKLIAREKVDAQAKEIASLKNQVEQLQRKTQSPSWKKK